jgi:ribosome-associated protein
MKYNIDKELIFDYIRSSGHGGQNVNKVSSKVQVKWNYNHSPYFSSDQKLKIKKYFKNHINHAGYIFLSSEKYREQIKNKEAVIKKLNELIGKALIVKKTRKTTKPTKASQEMRIQNKKAISIKKQNRRNQNKYFEIN